MIGSRLTRGCGFWHDWRQILLMVLTIVILAATQPFCEAAEPTDVTGTWVITKGIVRGKPIDMNELGGTRP